MSKPSHGNHLAAAEIPLFFDAAGQRCLGILHSVRARCAVGALLVVGGPQYRVGSHRQFVLMARALAIAGIPTFRFDYRGMGDSSGEVRDFRQIDIDIRAAVDAFVTEAGVERVIVWGLCDAASAALMYAHSDERIAGLVLLNPWVHSPETEAKVRLKAYYLERLCSRDLWRKLVALEFDWRDSMHSLWQYARNAVTPANKSTELGFIERMRLGWANFPGDCLLILSGNDITAAEFRQLTESDRAWQELLAGKAAQVVRLSDANHTFARAKWRAVVEHETVEWVTRLVRRHVSPS